jgi:nicotinamidase-related amidase
VTAQAQHCLRAGIRGRPIVGLLRPEEDDYLVLKPKHSGFYSTALELLLQYLGVRLLILTGVTGDVCVRFTANAAYTRDFLLAVPAGCAASRDPDRNRLALQEIEQLIDADVAGSAQLDFERLLARARES